MFLFRFFFAIHVACTACTRQADKRVYTHTFKIIIVIIAQYNKVKSETLSLYKKKVILMLAIFDVIQKCT